MEPGQKVAIVGPTGAGKTTLINLLMRFYELSGGSIQVDGVDIRQMSRAELRDRFGMVLQDTWLFEGAIADNIAYGEPDMGREKVIASARSACAHSFIKTLPGGYDMVLEQGGGEHLPGERQLITIARAIASDPEILILDEATSNVDVHTEVLIQKAMAELMKGRTSFVIAHRLSTIRDADMILYMEGRRHPGGGRSRGSCWPVRAGMPRSITASSADPLCPQRRTAQSLWSMRPRRVLHRLICYGLPRPQDSRMRSLSRFFPAPARKRSSRPDTVSPDRSSPRTSRMMFPESIIRVRLPSSRAWCILWVTIRVVIRCSATTSRVIRSTFSAVPGSRAAVCSSSSSSFGGPA